MACSFSIFSRSGRVSAPSPGPTSTKKSSLEGLISRGRRSITFRSCRKCCPNLRRATCGLLMGGRCEIDCELARFYEASRIGPAGAGNIQSRAVVDRRPDKRQAGRDVDGAAEAGVLEDRQTLV